MKKMTNADKIITMSDEKLVESIPCPHMTNVNREEAESKLKELEGRKDE